MDIKVDKNTVVVFDLDDTLYNEFDFLKSAYTHIAKNLEPKNHQHLLVLMLSLYRSQENVFEIVGQRYGQEMHSLIKMYRDHVPDIQLFNGVMPLMKEIKFKKGKIGIVTDGRVQSQMAKIEALKIMGLIDKIVISEAIGTEKPNRNNFKIIEDSLKGSTYYYIGDNLQKDFLAPNAMGWKTLGLIDNGLNIHHHSHLYLYKDHMPQHFFASYLEVRLV